MNTQYKKALAITAVVFLHVGVITLMLAQHGCKSDGAKANPSPPAAPAAMPAPTPAPVAADSNFVAPTRPPPVTPATPIPVAQYTEPLATVPTPAVLAPAPITPAVTWVVAKNDNLTSIAKKNGITVDELVAANAPKITKTSILRIGETLVVPSAGTSSQPTATTASTPAEGSVYTVVSGDSLSKIAQRNGTTIAALKSLNKLTSNTVRVGQKLQLPEATGASPAPASLGATSPSAMVDTSSGEYTVAPGDNLSKIAAKTGAKLSELMSLNNLTEAKARNLHPGQKLLLPTGTHAPETSTPATPAEVTPVPSLIPPLTPASNVTGVPAATTDAPITPVQ